MILGYLYQAVYVVFNFPSNYAIDKKGLRTGVLIGAICTCLGVWLKTMINYWFGFVFIGQTLAAIG